MRYQDLVILAILMGSAALSFAQAPASVTVPPDRINHGTFISGLVPSSAVAGGPEFVLSVRGFGFYNGVKVRWNGAERPTTFVDDDHLKATISAADIAKAENAKVIVREPDGFASDPVTFPVNNPAPIISSLSPPAIAASDKNFTLSLTGTNFVPNSDVKWNGQSRDVTFHNSSLITATILASDIADPGQATITVVNSTPGGGTSNPATFVTYAPGPPLVFPRLVSKDGSPAGDDSSEYTGIAVANLGSSKSTLLFTVYDVAGEPIQGSGITNPKSLDLNASQQLPMVDSQIFGAGLSARGSTGWIQLNSTAGKIAGFFLMFNRSLSILDGVDISDTTLDSFVFPEIEDQGFTKLHCANPNSDAVTLTLTLVSFNGSARAPAVERVITGHGVLTESFSDLFPGVEPTGSDYIRVTSTAGVVPFEVLGKTGQYIEGLRGQSATNVATTLYSPQYVVGGSEWRTSVSIVNLDSRADDIFMRFIKDDGTQIGIERRLQIAAGGKLHIDDQSFFVNPVVLTQGYLEIRGTVRLAGSVVFGDPQRSTFATALPLVSMLSNSAVFSQVASNDTYFTGLAILNPADAAASVTIEVYDSSGVLIASRQENIPAKQRKSQLLTQYFPELAGQNRGSGYIKFTADRPVASFALFGTHNLSVLSAIPPQAVP